MTDLSVVVATYDRPQLLAETLATVAAQTNALGLKIEVVVVDNHPSCNGRPTAEAMGARYLVEPTRNMSALRNTGFAAARSPLVAFIDDDERADPDWTDQLVGALRSTGAAVAVGPRYAVFAAGAPPPYDPTGSQFVRDLHLPDLADVPLTNAAGKPRFGLGTGNSLFDMARCFAPGEAPMRLSFGDAGGEDAELFVRLHRTGRRIVWAAKARVTETVPVHRTEVAYRLLRTRRETQHYVAIFLDGARRPGLVRLSLMAKGMAQFAVGALVAAATLEFLSTIRLRGRLLMAHGLGKLFADRAVGYIDEPVSAQAQSVETDHVTA